MKKEMNGYVILLKPTIDSMGKPYETYNLIPHQGEIELEYLYSLLECDYVGAGNTDKSKIIMPSGHEFNVPALTIIYDDELLIKAKNPQVNKMASLLWHTGRCLYGDVLLCRTTKDGKMIPFGEQMATRVKDVVRDMYV